MKNKLNQKNKPESKQIEEAQISKFQKMKKNIVFLLNCGK
jgi:hypothetical protein